MPKRLPDPFKIPLGGDIHKIAGVDNQGIIRTADRPWRYWDSKEHLQDLFLSCGYKQFSFSTASQQLLKFDGLPIEEFKNFLIARAAQNVKNREIYNKEVAQWDTQQKDLDGLMLCVIDADLYPTGFTIWISLNSKYNFKQQSQIAKIKKKLILHHVEIMCQAKRKYRKYASMMPYCQPVELLITRTNALAVKYEIKQKIQDILKEDEDQCSPN